MKCWIVVQQIPGLMPRWLNVYRIIVWGLSLGLIQREGAKQDNRFVDWCTAYLLDRVAPNTRQWKVSVMPSWVTSKIGKVICINGICVLVWSLGLIPGRGADD